MSLPAREEMFRAALRDLDNARNALSSSRDWLRSDWVPIGTPLPSAAAEARISVVQKIAQAKAIIDEAKAALAEGLDELG
ncbi:hypothetical protein [Nocardia gipuzkoensis]